MKSTVGLGLRHSFHDYVLENKPAVPWFEVITENYLHFDGKPRDFLHRIRELYPVVFHGVSLSIGSLEPVRLEYLKPLKNMIREFQPLWVSDHLCWTYNDAENSHDLLPVPFTQETLQRIISKTQQVQDFLGQKIYLENPSAYVDFAANEYTEADFISELCKSSGCGLLLDLNNLVVNKYNLGYEPVPYLKTIRNCDVKQIHLAGHTIKEKVRIDTHDNEVSQEVLDLLPLARKTWPEAKPMIEWDDKIPPVEELLQLREKIEIIWQKNVNAETISGNSFTETPPLQPSLASMPDHQKHQTFWNLLKKKDYVTQTEIEKTQILKHECPTPAHVGMNVYSSAYYNRLIEVLEKEFPVLKVLLNELFSEVMLEYLDRHPSSFDSIDFIGNKLAGFIEEHKFSYSLGADKKIIADVAAFENLSSLCSVARAENFQTLAVKKMTEEDWSQKPIKLNSAVLIYKANCEVHHIIHAVNNNSVPEVPELKNAYYMFYRQNHHACFKLISEDEYKLFQSYLSFKPFIDNTDVSAADLQKQAELLFKNEQFFCLGH